jgi:hypothetical protein
VGYHVPPHAHPGRSQSIPHARCPPAKGLDAWIDRLRRRSHPPLPKDSRKARPCIRHRHRGQIRHRQGHDRRQSMFPDLGLSKITSTSALHLTIPPDRYTLIPTLSFSPCFSSFLTSMWDALCTTGVAQRDWITGWVNDRQYIVTPAHRSEREGRHDVLLN